MKIIIPLIAALCFSSVAACESVGVNPSLIKVYEAAKNSLSDQGISISIREGVRTLAKQKKLVAKGWVKTIGSRHITGDAIDLDVESTVENTTHIDLYKTAAEEMKLAAKAHDVDLEWGGDWKLFPSLDHYQIRWGE